MMRLGFTGRLLDGMDEDSFLVGPSAVTGVEGDFSQELPPASPAGLQGPQVLPGADPVLSDLVDEPDLSGFFAGDPWQLVDLTAPAFERGQVGPVSSFFDDWPPIVWPDRPDLWGTSDTVDLDLTSLAESSLIARIILTAHPDWA